METAQVTRSAGLNALLAIAAAAVAGVVGCYGFGWLAGQGFYALALPGILIGLAAGFITRQRCMGVAMSCGIMALLAGLFCEWHWHRFIEDDSLRFFLAHLQDLRPFTLILLLLGTGCGFYFALGKKAKDLGPGAGQ